MGHLTTPLVGNPRNGQNYAVEVFDEHGRQICWCGPYNRLQRDTCVKLFVDAGWSTGASAV